MSLSITDSKVCFGADGKLLMVLCVCPLCAYESGPERWPGSAQPSGKLSPVLSAPSGVWHSDLLAVSAGFRRIWPLPLLGILPNFKRSSLCPCLHKQHVCRIDNSDD